MKVLVGFYGSEPAQQATRLVGSIHWPEGSTIRVMSVIHPVVDAAFSMPGMVTTPDALDQLAAAALTGAREAIEHVAVSLRRDGLSIETKVFEGRPASAIVEMARDFAPDLVVLGSHGRGQIASAVLGSVSAEVAESAPCSVLIARRDSITRLVLADDGSAGAMTAERLVATMPGFSSLPVHVVSVDELTTGWFSWLGLEAAAQIQDFEDAITSDRTEHEQAVERVADRLASAGLTATAEVRQGSAGRELVAAAHDAEADLIVLGAHGRSGASRLAFGGVARSVLQRAHCSVLIVRARAGKASATSPSH